MERVQVCRSLFLALSTASFSRLSRAWSWFKPRGIGNIPMTQDGIRFTSDSSLFCLCKFIIAIQFANTYQSGYKLRYRITKFGEWSTRNSLGCVTLWNRLQARWCNISYICQETSPIKWLEFFLNAFIVTVCTAHLIQRCWRVRFFITQMDHKALILQSDIE